MSVTLTKTGLDKLRTMVGVLNTSHAEVGVFADNDARSDGKSNASIGADHEFGLVSQGSKMPERSFLRMPLVENLKPTLDVSRLRAIMTTSMSGEELLDAVGRSGVETVNDAFDTGGFGQWPSLHHTTVEAKGNDIILIDSGELRESVAHRVV